VRPRPCFAALCAGALCALAAGSAAADWRELRISAALSGAAANASYATAGSAATGIGAGAGVDLAYGVSNGFEIGAAIRGARMGGMSWPDRTVQTPDRRNTFKGTLSSVASFAYAGPTLRIQTGDYRLTFWLAATAGVMRRSVGEATLVDDATGRVLLPYEDPANPEGNVTIPTDDLTSFAAGASVGVDWRLGIHYTLSLRLESLASVSGPGSFAGLFLPLALGYQFYP